MMSGFEQINVNYTIVVDSIDRFFSSSHFSFNLLCDKQDFFRRSIGLTHCNYIRKFVFGHEPLWCTPIDRRTCKALPHSLVKQLKSSTQILLAITQIGSYAEIYKQEYCIGVYVGVFFIVLWVD